MSAVAVAAGRIGVLLVNLGTPDALSVSSVRRYLREFLSDPRVIESNGLLWKLALHGYILRVRPARKVHDYEKIWNKERDESPLKTITRAQADKLTTELAPDALDVKVDWAMRYGNPSIASRLDLFAEQGCERILIVPLYPQYCAATTATVCDEVFARLSRMRWQPTIRVTPPYFDDPIYIEALANSIKSALASLSCAPEKILASFHGIPKEYSDKGDPYALQCAATTALLRQKLGFDETKLMMTFQSRFGRAEWLTPYTIETVKDLAERGCKNLMVIAPGFAADCLETLEEIAGENADVFRHHGGENFIVVPCLNDSVAGMNVIASIVRRELSGWL